MVWSSLSQMSASALHADGPAETAVDPVVAVQDRGAGFAEDGLRRGRSRGEQGRHAHLLRDPPEIIDLEIDPTRTGKDGRTGLLETAGRGQSVEARSGWEILGHGKLRCPATAAPGRQKDAWRVRLLSGVSGEKRTIGITGIIGMACTGDNGPGDLAGQWKTGW